MEFKNIAILTSKKSWFIPYGKELVSKFKEKRYNANARQFFNHKDISEKYEVVFILSYFNKIEKKYLDRHKHNLIVHESSLPEGRGWSPLFWQIFEGKNKIPIVLFEATQNIDGGNIYLKDYIYLEDHELHDEIRDKQGKKTIELCLEFLENYEKLTVYKQEGEATFYKKRSPENSKLNINKSIKSQFNLLRIVNNEKFPAFFEYKGHKYILKIFKGNNE